ncbi:rpsA, partial [Symbiodinium sp. CCMP2456]
MSYDGIVSHVRQEGFHVIVGDARGGRGHEGFLHISKLPTRVKSAYEVAKVCDKVRTKVLGIHKGGRLELAWAAKKPPHRHLRRGQWMTGKVYNIQKFGIFVEVATEDGPCQGLVHISEIKE